jgi:glutamate decarboxylase
MSSTVPTETVQPELVANWQTMQRIFIRPESKASRKALLKYMQQILFGLHDFLKKNVGITREASLLELSQRFTDSRINPDPAKKLAEVIRSLIEDIAPHAVNVASPYFVGHMTSAIPFFMVHLATIMAALNQNPVKLETSKVVSIFERQVLAKIYRQVFELDDRFYEKHVQNPESTLGSFVDDGTLANLTALWVARNTCLHPKSGFTGVEKEGIAAAFKAHNIDRCIVLVSGLAHHSLRKAGGVLGIGNENIIAVDVDDQNRINIESLTGLIDRYRYSKRNPG